MKCIVIEDEPLAQDVLKSYIADHPQLDLVGIFDSATQALPIIQQNQIQLLFLDINLPKISGTNFYQSLKNKPQVIFTTAYPEYAVTGFELEATDYLLKPFSFERFLTAVEKALVSSQKASNDGYLSIKEDKKYYRLAWSDILMIESIGDFARVHTINRTHLITQTLKSLETTLPSDRFIRVHKSYIVALEAITYLEGNRIKIREQMIPIGQSYREGLGRIFRG